MVTPLIKANRDQNCAHSEYKLDVACRETSVDEGTLHGLGICPSSGHNGSYLNVMVLLEDTLRRAERRSHANQEDAVDCAQH